MQTRRVFDDLTDWLLGIDEDDDGGDDCAVLGKRRRRYGRFAFRDCLL